MRRVVPIAIVLAMALIALSAVFVHPLFSAWLAIPIALATGLFGLRHKPLQAFAIAAGTTLGAVAAISVPAIVVTALTGGFASGERCDGFCMTDAEGAALATFILSAVAGAAAFAGGFLAFVVSLGARPETSEV